MTRLADVTGLDRIGVPVWQAVRPWSRALSVAQGKGLSEMQARISAAMEAVECACAENWSPPPIDAAWAALAASARTVGRDDFALYRDHGPAADAVQPWAEAVRLDGGGKVHVAFDAVSLDLTRAGEPGIERGSTGLAAHLTADAVIRVALHEVIERDAAARWGAGRESLFHAPHRVALETVPGAWFGDLRERLSAATITLRIYALPAVITLPVFVATLTDAADADGAHAAVYGEAAHGDPQVALRNAVLEAVQARLTLIAGARDDLPIVPAHRPMRGLAAGLGGLMPSGVRARDFASILPFGSDEDAGAVIAMVEALARAGFNQAAVVDLAPPEFPVAVVKVVVPGLASATRARR